MLSPEEVLKLINDPNYKREKSCKNWHDVYLGMSLHIDGVTPSFKDIRTGITNAPPGWVSQEYDYLFDQYYLNKYPTENEVTRQWRKSVYRPNTRAPFLQVISTITGAIFQDSGYNITVSNKDDYDYIWGSNFDGKNLINYLSDRFKYICADPNGQFVVIPKDNFQEKDGKIQPDIWFVPSKNILYSSEEETVFKKDDFVYWINTLSIFRYKKNEGSSRYVDYDGEGYYAHMLGYKPCFVAGGTWNTQGYYDSWLANAKPLADEHISTYSSLQHINKDATHPYVIFSDSKCPDCNGVAQSQLCEKCHTDSSGCQCNDPANWKLVKCNTCAGSGRVAHNPGDVMIAPPEMMEHDLIKIINRDTSANKYLFEFSQDLYNQIFRSLYLNYIEQAQSGVAKDKDMESRYQFLLNLSKDLFDRLISGIVSSIIGYRNLRLENGVMMPDPEGFTIVNPTQFQIKTAYDLLEEYKIATESKLPAYQRAALLMDYAGKYFGGDELLNKKAYIINELDILNVATDSEIQLAVLNGAASQRDYQFHLRLPNILNRIVREKGKDWVLKVPFATIEAEVQSIFDAMIPPPIQLPNDNQGS